MSTQHESEEGLIIPSIIVETIAKLVEDAPLKKLAKKSIKEFARRQLRERMLGPNPFGQNVTEVLGLLPNQAAKIIDKQSITESSHEITINGDTITLRCLKHVDGRHAILEAGFSDSSVSRARALLKSCDDLALALWNDKRVDKMKEMLDFHKPHVETVCETPDVCERPNICETPTVARQINFGQQPLSMRDTLPSRDALPSGLDTLPSGDPLPTGFDLADEQRRLLHEVLAVKRKRQRELEESRKTVGGRWTTIEGTVEGEHLEGKLLQLSAEDEANLKEMLLRLDKWTNTKEGKQFMLNRAANTRETDSADPRCKQLPGGFHCSSMGQIVNAQRMYSFDPGMMPWLAGTKAEDTVEAYKRNGVDKEELKLSKDFLYKYRPVSRDCDFIKTFEADLHAWIIKVFGPGSSRLPKGPKWLGDRFSGWQGTFSAGGLEHLMKHKDACNGNEDEIPPESMSMSINIMTDEHDHFDSGLGLIDDFGEIFPGPGCFIGPLHKWPHRVVAPLHGKRVSISLYLNGKTLRSAKLAALPVALKMATTKAEAESAEREFQRAVEAVYGGSSSGGSSSGGSSSGGSSSPTTPPSKKQRVSK